MPSAVWSQCLLAYDRQGRTAHAQRLGSSARQLDRLLARRFRSQT